MKRVQERRSKRHAERVNEYDFWVELFHHMDRSNAIVRYFYGELQEAERNGRRGIINFSCIGASTYSGAISAAIEFGNNPSGGVTSREMRNMLELARNTLRARQSDAFSSGCGSDDQQAIDAHAQLQRTHSHAISQWASIVRAFESGAEALERVERLRNAPANAGQVIFW
ncbi:uncharacterized protein LOC117640454 [Thrips palmi]|uniref:Uncharacterized protein LOC117640454 n=1 Tax=Thrips palmi TaxID=161013 RepID=A0A6P8Y082_THRPL|nr:uncharacterized protein LOC117640454 [Thrips palmi]